MPILPSLWPLAVLVTDFSFWALWRLDLPGLHGEDLAPLQPLLSWKTENPQITFLGYHGISESLMTLPFFALFGETEFAVRFSSFFYALLSIPLFYFWMLSLHKEKKWAFLGTWLLAASPTFIMATREGIHHGVLMFPPLLAAFLFFHFWHRSDRPVFLMAAALSAGLALGTRSWLYALLNGVFVLAVLNRKSLLSRLAAPRRRLQALAAMLLLFAASGMPLIFLNLHLDKHPLDISQNWFTAPRYHDTAYLSRAARRLADFNRHLRQTMYGQEGNALPENPLVWGMFWAGALLIVLASAVKYLKGGGSGPQDRHILFIAGFFLYLAQISFSVRSTSPNHLLCAYVLAYPNIVLGPFIWLRQTGRPLLSKASLAALIAIMVAASVKNVEILGSFKEDLVQTGGRRATSPVWKELAEFAVSNKVETLVLFDTNYGGIYGKTVRFYSGGRVSIEYIPPTPAAVAPLIKSGVNTGFVSYCTDAFNEELPLTGEKVTFETIRELLPDTPRPKRTKTFRGKNGDPEITLHLYDPA